MTPNERICAYFVVTGRVQGVSYRAATQAAAERFGLTGWVRNRHDGAVEVAACGEAEQVDVFERWLWQGPRLAVVASVSRDALSDAEEFPDFRIRY